MIDPRMAGSVAERVANRDSWSGGVEQLPPGAVVAVASGSHREPHERPLGIEPLLARPGYFVRWCQLQFGDRSWVCLGIPVDIPSHGGEAYKSSNKPPVFGGQKVGFIQNST
jgi:hypothetical protein